MQKYFLVLLCSIYLVDVVAQNIGINATGTLPHPSAMLDVSASDKGILIPRTSTISRTAISGPAKGLMVYDTTTSSFWYHNGNMWTELAGGTAGTGTSPWNQSGTNIFNSNAGNVGIGTITPLAPLHIKNDSEAVRLSGTTPYISFNDDTGTRKGFLQSYKNDLYLGTPSTNTTGILQFYLKNVPVFTVLPAGNIGIGTTAPANKLTVQTSSNNFGFTHSDGAVTVGSWIGNFNGATGGWLGTKSNHPLNLFTNNGGAKMTVATNGNIGFDATNPVNRLQIGNDVGALRSYDIAIGNYGNSMGIYQGSPLAYLVTTTNMIISSKNGTGNIGIGALGVTPNNKLQIGSVGNTGFSTNDLAIGNGTNAMAIYQTDASTLIGATTDIVLKPRNNGFGRVGINTNTPRGMLDVDGWDVLGGHVSYYSYMNGVSDLNGIGLCKNCNPQISIVASYGVYAAEFDAFSDARIKNIQGVSNATQDLKTLNKLHITDYTMKDKVKYGDRRFKKVIAQEVEKIYPQAVSTHADFIPNVYQGTSKITKTDDGFLLQFAGQHHISSNAKKLRVLVKDKGMQVFDITSIPANNEVRVSATELDTNQLFVYGEEVNDFRTVDYEALTTLSISASQEISRVAKNQAVTIAAQQRQINLLEKRLAALEKNHPQPIFHKAD